MPKIVQQQAYRNKAASAKAGSTIETQAEADMRPLAVDAVYSLTAWGALSQGAALVVVCKVDAQPCSIAWRGHL